MKKIRQHFWNIKEGFLDAELEKILPAAYLANKALLSIIYFIICFSSMIFIALKLDYIAYIITGITIIGYLFINSNEEAFSKFIPLSFKLLIHFFGKFGRVVTKEDWKRIKRDCPKGYKACFSKKSLGHCYYYSRGIALFLEDAELMYCSIRVKAGDTGHAVIVKNNCVYDINMRRHFTLEEYKELCEVKVYKMFSKKEYWSKDFFDNIREGFVQWCAENNVYCDPQ